MKIGVTLRNMGAQSTPTLLMEAACAAEAAGMESIWITDHIAIPPDDAEGSDGRYLDPLITLAAISSATRKIGLGAGVLILPYRPALPSAKQIATLQELSGGRLLLGAGIGWMDAEFRALGLDRHHRGAASDGILAFLRACFDAPDDVMVSNGQPFLFRPNPSPPPIYIGGRAPHALARAVRHDAGWLPMETDPERLARDMAAFRRLAEAQGQVPGPVTLMTPLPLAESDRSRDLLDAYRSLGVERLVCAVRYEDLSGYEQALVRIRALL